MTDRPIADLNEAYSGGALRVRMPAPRIDLDENGPSVSVVIPAMNEAKNLPWVAERMPRGVAEIILVDGRSEDDTIKVARSLWPAVRVVTQIRRGKGNALACGFEAATGEVIVMIDADGSMDPGEIPYFVAALQAGADYAKGSRFCAGGGSSDITRVRALGNRALNRLTRAVHKTGYTDLCYGYNAFWRRILPVLDLDAGDLSDDSEEKLWGDGFEVETLINIRVHLAGLVITEVPSFETPRINGASNLNAFSDGIRVVTTIGRESRALHHGTKTRRGVISAILRPRPAPAGLTDDVAVAPMHSAVEIQHDAERGVLLADGTDATAGVHHDGVRSLTSRDLEVVDLTALQRALGAGRRLAHG
jgi:glycosyltransferase involved in cell wall biosynthesis